ncbi:MAG: hypothetical protein ACM3S2_15500 [Ignavibacteriales bacterium]
MRPGTLFSLSLLIFSLSIPLKAQEQNGSEINSFFRSLISGSKDLAGYVLPSELAKSQRLGISYNEAPDKFLISFDIDASVKEKIRNGNNSYEVLKENLEDGFTKAVFQVKKLNYKKDFYFRNGKLVSGTLYFTRNWKNYTTGYFDFYISDTSYFNDYSARELETFVEGLCDLLKLDNRDKEILQKNKIIYILCRNAEEIERLTGFNTRGIYLLAYDEVVSTYNCHFHELAHLLMNFKLRNLPLYTLPFFQEGFATAVGGRGGIRRSVLLDIGCFLQKSGYIPFNSILTRKEFSSEDASTAYSVSALYNMYLLQEYGIEPYLKLYRNYSGSDSLVSGLKPESIQLPPNERFNSFLNRYENRSGISFEEKGTPAKLIYEGKSGRIYEGGNFYKIRLRSNMLFSQQDTLYNYISKKFTELLPKTTYRGAKYLITADKKEVNVYNLYTNDLIALYSTGYSLNNMDVPVKDGYFDFYLNKSVFDEDLEYLQVSDF